MTANPWARGALLLGLAVSLTACSGSGRDDAATTTAEARSYTTEEVRRAFRAGGMRLGRDSPLGNALALAASIGHPPTHELMLLVFPTVREADDAWRKAGPYIRSLGPAEHFANVIVEILRREPSVPRAATIPRRIRAALDRLQGIRTT